MASGISAGPSSAKMPQATISTAVGYNSNTSLTANSGGYIHTPYIPAMAFEHTVISSIDDCGKIGMGHNNVHIQPTDNGFIVTVASKEQGISTSCFDEFEKVVAYLSELGIMTLNDERVADNV
jgi:hypothetical protein